MDHSRVQSAWKVAAVLLLGFLLATSLTVVGSDSALACVGRLCPPPDPPSGGRGGFEGTAALFDSDKKQVFTPSGSPSSCPECVWETTPVCEAGGGAHCGITDQCVRDGEGGLERASMRAVKVQRQGWTSPQEDVGTYCAWRGQELRTVEDLGRELREDWRRDLPPLKPVSQPKGGKTLVGNGFVTIFHSGQDSKTFGPKRVSVSGFPGRLTATGKWIWNFDDGATDEFDIPGSRYPDKTVGHVYTTTGKYRPSVRTEWEGRFSVMAGGQWRGPWDIEEPAWQASVGFDLEVVESLPVLGGGDR